MHASCIESEDVVVSKLASQNQIDFLILQYTAAYTGALRQLRRTVQAPLARAVPLPAQIAIVLMVSAPLSDHAACTVYFQCTASAP